LGFLIGVSMGALGGGGSMLAVPALVYAAGETAAAATTTSLLAVGAIAFTGMVGHLRGGRVRLGPGLVFGLVGMGGSFGGTKLSRVIPEPVLLLAFAALILVAAWRMRGKHTETPCHTHQVVSTTSAGMVRATPPKVSARDPEQASVNAPPPPARARNREQGPLGTAVRVLIAGTVVGFLTGLFGVGGGFIIVPALVLALGYEMPVAVGTSLLVIGVSSAEGLLFRLSHGEIDWRVAIPFTGAGLIGVLLGDRIAARVPATALTRWFVWLLVAVAVYTAARSLIAL
jgi:uncharacterized membrane protein YfcA